MLVMEESTNDWPLKKKIRRKKVPGSFNKFLSFREEGSHLLECGWVGCGQMFISLEVLTMHLREVHLFASQQCEQPLHCFWQLCEHFDGVDEFHLTVHVMFHAYHTKLKASGQAALESSKLECLLVANPSSIPDQPVGGYVCEYDQGQCLEVFDSFHSFLTHLSCHVYSFSEQFEDEELFRCQWLECPREAPFNKRAKLLEHMRCHTGAKCFACPQCGTLFTTIEKLKGHCVRQIMDEEAKMFKCNLCNVSFVSQPLLSEHMRTHVKLYQCDQCPLPFPTKSALKNHWKYKHSNIREFPCMMPQCSYSAKKRNDLLKHLKNHRQTCNHTCSFCGEMFRTKASLDNHLEQSHSVMTRKEYICHLCGPSKTYCRGRSLTEHLKTKHNYESCSYKRFQYMQAPDGKYYLTQEEYHEYQHTGVDADGESFASERSIKKDFMNTLNDLNDSRSHYNQWGAHSSSGTRALSAASRVDSDECNEYSGSGHLKTSDF